MSDDDLPFILLMGFLAALAAFMLGGLVGDATADKGIQPEEVVCASEDMLAITITEDGYEFEAGDSTCIHFDDFSELRDETRG